MSTPLSPSTSETLASLPTFMGDFVILYVRDPLHSAAFYERVLGRAPLEASPGFVMFELAPGRRLGLWLSPTVQPPAGPAGGAEIAFPVPGQTAVQQLHDRWLELGVPIAQAPIAMDFGYTFVGRDPDGHPLRVFSPTA